MTSLIESDEDYTPPVKLKKTTNEDDHNDIYCFECHDEGDVICCESCPRVYHPKCVGLTTLPEGDWMCPECEAMQSNRSIPTSSMKEFYTMLKYALRRMKTHPQAGPFMRPVDPIQMPEYLDYIVYPMDLETIEQNIDLKKYNSTEAFLADVKWITHNSVVFNGTQSKFTMIARSLLKIARHEMTEIEICPECYLHSAQPVVADWFAQPCSLPHTLCWAKMKGYQPWPAKVLRIVNDEVDVRFFGQHDRAWVSINNCVVLSKEYPGVEKKKSNMNFEKSLTELQTHIDRLKELYGTFTYAPPQTTLSKTKPFKFVSIIDDSIPPVYVSAVTSRFSIKHFKQEKQQQRSPPPSFDSKIISKRPGENSHGSNKRLRLSSKHTDDNGPISNRIVLRIRKPSEDLSANRSDTLHSNNNYLSIVHTKESFSTRIEDEQSESSSSLNVFDIFDQTNSPHEQQQQITKQDQNSLSIVQSSSSCIENKTPIHALLSKYVDRTSSSSIDRVTQNVKLTINALLDAVETIKPLSEIHRTSIISSSNSEIEKISTTPQFAQRRMTLKQSRKSHPYPRVTTSQTKSNHTSNVMLPLSPFEQNFNEQSLLSTATLVRIRPLSVSPTSADMFEDTSTVNNDEQHQELERPASIETFSVKAEPFERLNSEEQHRAPPPLQPSSGPARLLSSPSPPNASSLSTKSFMISPPSNTHHHKSKVTSSSTATTTTTISNAHFVPTMNNSNNTFAPRIASAAVPPVSKNIWPAPVPGHTSTRQPPSTTHKRPGPSGFLPTAQRNNNTSNNGPSRMNSSSTSLPPPSFESFSINPPPPPRRSNGTSHPILPSNTSTSVPNRNTLRMPQFNNNPPVRPALDDHQTPGEIQMIVNTFNDKFQQLLVDFTVKIEAALESNRTKYEKDLEETRRSYRVSMNELRSITTQQVQEMRNSLELQYWTRLSEMRNRYESTLQQQQQTKSTKQQQQQLNGSMR